MLVYIVSIQEGDSKTDEAIQIVFEPPRFSKIVTLCLIFLSLLSDHCKNSDQSLYLHDMGILYQWQCLINRNNMCSTK